MGWQRYSAVWQAVLSLFVLAGCSREDANEPAPSRIAVPITSGPCNFSAPPPLGTPSNRTFTIKVPNGTLRDTVVYSITAAEWPTVQAHLEFQLNDKPR